jgi:CRISPR-associated protein Cmr6
MPIAAVPGYLQSADPDFYLAAPPGHRFLLYFPVWGHNGEAGGVDWRTKDRVKKYRRKAGQLVDDGWTDLANDQFACTIAAGKKPAHVDETPRARRPSEDQGLAPWRQMIEALARRQTAAAQGIPQDARLRLDAIAQAPFATGLGNEHPLENGFAFLNPYGLPYLPGTGVKGVLRQAARELASGEWGDSNGWSTRKVYPLMQGEGDKRKPVIDDGTKQPINLSLLDVLFGLESKDGDKVHVRAALSFWDVIPQIAGDSLMVEIMTPHQSHYYQPVAGSTGPHDSGSPNPISFLTVPPGSGFAFHVVCDVAHLARLTRDHPEGAPDLLAEGDRHWQSLLRHAFEHAFAWLGFGAKTAVGYGAMRRDSEAEVKAAKLRAEREAQAQRQREAAEREARRAAMSENMRRVEAFKEEFAARAEQLRGGKEKPNAAYHDRARRLAKDALEGAAWTAEERRAAAEAIEEWLPKVVQVDLKDERKKLRLAALKGQA